MSNIESADRSVFTVNFLAELDRLGLKTTPEAARFLQIPERQVSRYKDGQEPRLVALVLIANAFERSIDWMLTPHPDSGAKVVLIDGVKVAETRTVQL